MTLELSVVVATFNRIGPLQRLLLDLERQSLDPSRFEVCVVDDGSAEPVEEALSPRRLPLRYALSVVRQPNQGAAAARHAGALRAKAPVVVFLDDDMRVGRDFLEAHLRAQGDATRRVVLGRIRAAAPRMPLFERWHSRQIDRLAEAALAGTLKLRGIHLFTGNVSLRRQDYLAVGGFDPSLGNSEDIELGIRLERHGCQFELAEDAVSFHASDHHSRSGWLDRARRYGRYGLRIARKHPEEALADPWRYWFELNPLLRPLISASLAVPELARPAANVVMAVAEGLGRVGLERVALTGATAAHALEFFRGLRDESGSLPSVMGLLAASGLARLEPRSPTAAALRRGLRAVKADQLALQRSERKYGHPDPSRDSLAADLIQKVGLQQLALYRAMRICRELRWTLAAKALSRINRYLHGSDVHWDAELAPGVTLVHGFGLAISHSAKVAEGCILFQNVTLGMGTDPVTRVHGAPTVENDVHIGPGATLIGPITIGAGSKIMAGAVVTQSIPPRSRLEVPLPSIQPRARNVVAPTPGAQLFDEVERSPAAPEEANR